MASPFEFFRKRKTGMMVVMVILSMLLFTLDALFMQQGANFWLLGLLLGGAVFGIAGVSSGKWLPWGIGGAAFGAFLGFILPTFVVTPGSVEAKFGVIDGQEIFDDQEQRMIANQFIGLAREESLGAWARQFPAQFGFGKRDAREDLLFGRLMEKEADELGIVVTDGMVNDYIKRETDQKLTREAFAKIRTSMSYQNKPLVEETLYNILRRQIKAQMALEILLPVGSVSPPTPDMYWKYFQRLNVRQQVNLTALDVDAFLDQVKDPSDPEIEQAFATYGHQYPNQIEPGAPGFRLYGRARLAWLEVDYDTVEATVEPVSDAEVEAHYNEFRDTIYRVPVLPDETRPGDDKTSADDADSDGADGDGTENKDSGKDETSTQTEDAAAGGDTDDADTSDPAATADSTPVNDSEDSAEATTEPDSKTDESANNSDGNDPLIIPKAPSSDDKDAEQDPPIEYKFRELDDDLKNEIRSELLQRRTREAIEEKMKAAELMMSGLARQRAQRRTEIVNSDPAKYEKLIEPDSELVASELRAELEKFTPELLKEMKDFAGSSGMTFVETPFLDYSEFRDPDNYPLGSAVEPGQSQFNSPGATNAANTIYAAFTDDPVNNDTQLFLLRRAVSQADSDDSKEIQYVYWAISFSEPHIPTLDEPGVREKVVLAIKRQKARELVTARAEELTKKTIEGLKKEGDDRLTMAASLKTETITGHNESATLLVQESQPFSWLRKNETSPTSFQQAPRAEVSRIRFTDDSPSPDDLSLEFFETVFESMNDEDVRVIPNFDRSRYYVVHVTNRFPTPELGTEDMLERFGREGRLSFLNSPISEVMRGDLISPSVAKWEQSIWQKYEIVPEALKQ